MNAIQFIQQHGVDKAREVVEGAPKWAMSINFNNGMYYSRMEHKKGDTFLYDIKRLVESVDLVESFNGVEMAKRYLEENVECSDSERLKQAIADYESIYSNDMGDDTHIENHVSPNCKVGGEVMRSGFEEYYSKKYPNDQCTLIRNGNYSGWLKQQHWEQWQHQQSKVDELTKQRDSFIKAYEIEMDKSVELQKRVDAALKMISINRGFAWGSVSISRLEQALKGES